MTSEYKHIYQAGSENLGLRRKPKNKYNKGTSLGVQWLRLSASAAGAWIQFLVGELRSSMPCGMAKNNNNNVGATVDCGRQES